MCTSSPKALPAEQYNLATIVKTGTPNHTGTKIVACMSNMLGRNHELVSPLKRLASLQGTSSTMMTVVQCVMVVSHMVTNHSMKVNSHMSAVS